jgi:hypothetical protein
MSSQISHNPICPQCQQLQSKVIEARASLAGSVRRRRSCICGYRFTTYEQVETVPRLKALWLALGIGRDAT